LDGQLVFGHGDHAAVVAVDDGDRRAPVALAGYEPVAEAVVHGGAAAAFGLEPLGDLGDGLVGGGAIEGAGVDEVLVAGVLREGLILWRLPVGGCDNVADGEV